MAITTMRVVSWKSGLEERDKASCLDKTTDKRRNYEIYEVLYGFVFWLDPVA